MSRNGEASVIDMNSRKYSYASVIYHLISNLLWTKTFDVQ